MKIKTIITTLAVTTALAGTLYFSNEIKSVFKEGYTSITQSFSEAQEYVEQKNPFTKKTVAPESKLEQKVEEKTQDLPKQITTTQQEAPKEYNTKSSEEAYNKLKDILGEEYTTQKDYVLRKLSQPLYERVADEFDQYLAQKLDEDRIINRAYIKTDQNADKFSQEQLLNLDQKIKNSLEKKLTTEERAKNNYDSMLKSLPEFSQQALLGLSYAILNRFSEESYDTLIKNKSANFWAGKLNKVSDKKICKEED